MSLVEQLDKNFDEAIEALKKASDEEQVEAVRIQYLGRKGIITAVLKQVKDLPPSEKPVVGQKANKIRNQLEEQIKQTTSNLSSKKLEAALKESTFDYTLPGKLPPQGSKHLISQITEEVVQILTGLGYQVAEGPEVEIDYYNFTALNMPPGHPARSLQDTLYLEDMKGVDQAVLLRTHTSPIQVRVMETKKPPLYIIAPGKVFRRDIADPSHSPMFHQIEGLAVAEGINFSHLKGTLEVLVKKLFGADRAIRLRPHFFPYTEPSAEVDVSCALCNGAGCRLCGGNGWLEILGCGMVDPNVLEGVGIDSEKFTGFAFGVGVERIAVLRHGLDDIRRLFDNDVRFLEQF